MKKNSCYILILGFSVYFFWNLVSCSQNPPSTASTTTTTTVVYYTITFDKNDLSALGSMEVQTVAKGVSETISACVFNKPGYVFAGWSLSPEGEVVYENSGAIVLNDGDITLYANYNVRTFYVIFEKNSDLAVGSMPSQPIDYGETVVLAPNVFLNTGFIFSGWATSPSGEIKYADCASFKIGLSDLTLYAVWETALTITFDSQGGSPVESNVLKYGDKLPSPDYPVLSGFIFDGWYLEKTPATKWDFINDFVKTDDTLYAKWISEKSVQSSISTSSLSENINLIGVSCSTAVLGARPVNLTSFYIAVYETTYGLWYEVKNWGEANGYVFANPGREGSDATPDGTDPSIAKDEPVSDVNWRDCVVWLNALSAKEGLTPVYYTDEACLVPLKESTNTNIYFLNELTPGLEDNPFVKWSASGYRLPTEAEWEYVARYIDGVKQTEWDRASGDDADNKTIESVTAVAWCKENSSSKTQNVGAKNPNALGLYDMSGNISELCWDWYGEWGKSELSEAVTDPKGAAYAVYGKTRVTRGEYYDVSGLNMRSGQSYLGMYPYDKNVRTGFRFVRRPE